MGQKLSNIYFDPSNGKANLRWITTSTIIMVGLYLNTYIISLGYVKDNSMIPFMKTAGFPFSDTVAYWKFTNPKEKLQNKIVAIKDPFS